MSNNKRNSKQKWVPLEIDTSKSRSKRDRTPRNRRREVTATTNGNGSAAAETSNDDEYYTDRQRVRRFRPASSSASSYRGGRISNTSRGGARRPNAKTASSRNRLGASNEYSDYQSEYSSSNKKSGGSASYLMPYLGTFYFNGVPYSNMDTVAVKDAIKKQM